MCMLRDCAVCECEDSEVPQLWKAEEGKCKGLRLTLYQHNMSAQMVVQLRCNVICDITNKCAHELTVTSSTCI